MSRTDMLRALALMLASAVVVAGVLSLGLYGFVVVLGVTAGIVAWLACLVLIGLGLYTAVRRSV